MLILLVYPLELHTEIRDIAQLGRAPALGAGGRRFKSYYPECSIATLKINSFKGRNSPI